MGNDTLRTMVMPLALCTLGKLLDRGSSMIVITPEEKALYEGQDIRPSHSKDNDLVRQTLQRANTMTISCHLH